jgi:hypothetical protein
MPAPENPLFLAASKSIDRALRSYKSVASLQAIQPSVAHSAGATSLPTGGMVVTRNQVHGSTNPFCSAATTVP